MATAPSISPFFPAPHTSFPFFPATHPYSYTPPVPAYSSYPAPPPGFVPAPAYAFPPPFSYHHPPYPTPYLPNPCSQIHVPPSESTSPPTTAPPATRAQASALPRCPVQAPGVPLTTDLSCSKAETNGSAFQPHAAPTATNRERRPPQPWVASSSSRVLESRAQQNGDLSSSSPTSASDLPAPASCHVYSGTKEVRKYLAYDDDTAAVHPTVTQNPFHPLAPSYENTSRQPCDYQQRASSNSYAHQVFETMPSLQGRVLTVKLHHKVCPISIEQLHRIFLSCGVVEKMIYIAHVHSPRVFIQYQNAQMAAQAMWVLQGKCIPETYCQLEIQLAHGSDFHTFQDCIYEMNFQSGPGGYNVGHNISESPREREHKREPVQQILSCLPGPNTDGFDTMDQKAHTVDGSESIPNMLAPIQAKLQNISENLSRYFKRRESQVSKQPAASQPKHSTREALNVSDEMPLSAVYAAEDKGCSNESVVVLADTPRQQLYEEEQENVCDCTLEQQQQNGETASVNVQQLRAPRLNLLEIDESIGVFASTSKQQPHDEGRLADVQHFSLELQPQDEERTLNCPVLEPSDSYVTRYNQLSTVHRVKELRLLWDPRDEKIHDTLPVAADATKLQCKSAMLQASALLVLVVPCSTGILSLIDMMLTKTTVPNRMDLKHFWAHLLLQFHSWCTSPHASFQVQEFFLPIVLDCLYSESFKQLICYSSIFSSTAMYLSTATTVHMMLGLNSGKVTHEEKDVAALYKVFKIQLQLSKNSRIWDPGVKIFLCSWLNMLTEWNAADTQFPCIHIIDVAVEPNQSASSIASYIMDDWVTLTPVVTLINEQWSFSFNAMHYCQIFEKCIAMSYQLYWHEDIKFIGIALWLITFNPP